VLKRDFKVYVLNPDVHIDKANDSSNYNSYKYRMKDCKLRKDCDGHKITINGCGPWKFHNHTKEGLDSSLLMMAMGSEYDLCSSIYLLMSRRCRTQENKDFEILVPDGWYHHDNFIFSTDLESSEFIKLYTGLHLLKRIRRNSRPSGSDSSKYSVDDFFKENPEHEKLTGKQFRSLFIESLLKKLKNELIKRKVKTQLNSISPRSYTSSRMYRMPRTYGRAYAVTRLRFTRKGNGTFLDAIDCSPDPRQDTYYKTAKQLRELEAEDKNNRDITKIIFMLSGLTNSRNRLVDSADSIQLVGPFLDEKTIDISYLATCLEAAWFQSICNKLYGPGTKIERINSCIQDEIKNMVKNRSLNMSVESSLKQRYTYLPYSTQSTGNVRSIRKMEKVREQFSTNIRISLNFDIKDIEHDCQRIKTMLKQFILEYDKVKKLK